MANSNDDDGGCCGVVVFAFLVIAFACFFFDVPVKDIVVGMLRKAGAM